MTSKEEAAKEYCNQYCWNDPQEEDVNEGFLAGVQWRDSTLPALLQKAYIMGVNDGRKGDLRAPQWSEFMKGWNL